MTETERNIVNEEKNIKRMKEKKRKSTKDRYNKRERLRGTDRQTDRGRQTVNYIERQTDRNTDKQTYIQRDGQTETETDRELAKRLKIMILADTDSKNNDLATLNEIRRRGRPFLFYFILFARKPHHSQLPVLNNQMPEIPERQRWWCDSLDREIESGAFLVGPFGMFTEVFCCTRHYNTSLFGLLNMALLKLCKQKK